MSHLFNNTIDFTANILDSFGRLKVSTPTKLFDSTHVYNDFSNKYSTTIVGTGSTTSFNTADSTQSLTVGTANGCRVLRESNQYMHYEPGSALQIVMTGVLGSPKTNVTSRLGYYDDNDGYYFAQTSTGPAIVERTSSITGAMQETVVSQANWNVDKMDGTGKSGITLDMSKANIYMFDLQWLGVGLVRCFVDIGGVAILVHQFAHANLLSSLYIKTADLPLRYEILTTGTAASTTSMKQACSTVIVDGVSNPLGSPASVDTPAAVSITSGTTKPLLSLQLASTVNSVKNRGFYSLTDLSIMVTNNSSIIYRVLWNATLTGASFGAVSAKSSMNYDTTATAVSGGTALYAGHLSTSSSLNLSQVFDNRHQVFFANPGATNPTLTIVAQSISGTASVYAGASWNEYR